MFKKFKKRMHCILSIICQIPLKRQDLTTYVIARGFIWGLGREKEGAGKRNSAALSKTIKKR